MHKLRIYISYKILIFKRVSFSCTELVICGRKACLSAWMHREAHNRTAISTTNRKPSVGCSSSKPVGGR